MCVQIAHIVGIKKENKRNKYAHSIAESLHIEADKDSVLTEQAMMVMNLKTLINEKEKSRNEHNEFTIKWQFAARVLNRFFFFVSVTLCAIIYASFFFVVVIQT